MANVLCVSEIQDGKVKKGTYSALACARQIAGPTGGSVSILALGAGIGSAVEELEGYGAAKVYVRDDGTLGGYLAERYAPIVAATAKAGGHDVVVSVASAYGKDLMPRVAARLGAGLASDVSSVQVDGGKILFRRPLYAGNVLGTLAIKTPIACATVRQSEFEPAQPAAGSSQVVDAPTDGSPAAERVQFLGVEIAKSERPELTDARVVVAGGRGMKSAENFKLLDPLIDLLGGAMGASRAAVDAGFVPNDLQVGQTGKVVAPELYIAVGISGAIQHIAGMKSSKVIVAINKDPEAPIFQVADYGLVADLFKAVPELTEELRKLKAQG
ncbi:MAG: electron transfer flavoprotein subunit alpha/FixB family protein [Deltaproteobacteria bacterium]|nr:electron transfer flavoprotein subunit alpha/FixB family protein [Deltaproteobacteria bacterium]